MASRFGGVSPAQSYATRIKWLVAGLVCVIAVLVSAVLYIAQTTAAPEVKPVEQAAPQVLPGSTVDILISGQRIEEGSVLQDHMFRPKAWNPDELPEGVVLARDVELIRGKFAKSQVSANIPMLQDYISPTRPISALNIPPGFRAVTIEVDKRTGVEGFAKPNTRVDVLWTYQGPDRKQKVSTIVRFCKVLSVGGAVSTEGTRAQVAGKTTVTLLVTEVDAKKIELARTLGSLSLSLVGDTEAPTAVGEETDSIDISDLLGEKPEGPEAEEQAADGVMYSVDPATGKRVRCLLKSGRWKCEKGS